MTAGQNSPRGWNFESQLAAAALLSGKLALIEEYSSQIVRRLCFRPSRPTHRVQKYVWSSQINHAKPEDDAFLDDSHDHQHDNRVTSVGFNVKGEVDQDPSIYIYSLIIIGLASICCSFACRQFAQSMVPRVQQIGRSTCNACSFNWRICAATVHGSTWSTSPGPGFL